jgi:hypothetical protein
MILPWSRKIESMTSVIFSLSDMPSLHMMTTDYQFDI